MKAIVVEIKNEFAAVLSDDGCITKVKNNNYAIGQVIQMNKKTTPSTKKLKVWISTAAAFLIICGIGAWIYLSPYTYVSLDVNPSIEYSLNIFDHVLSVKAVNDDGQEILKNMQLDDLTFVEINKAMALTIEQIAEEGYFTGDIEGGIVITTAGNNQNKAEELAEELQTSVETETQDLDNEITVETFSVGLERVKEARELGVTPGKLNLVQKLQDSADLSESVVIEDWLDKPVKEIMHAIKENKKADKEAAKNDKKQKDENTETTTESSTEASSEATTETTTQTSTQGNTETTTQSPTESISDNELILKPGKGNKKVPSTNKATNETITATTQSETTQATSENTTEVTRGNGKRPSKPETATTETTTQTSTQGNTETTTQSLTESTSDNELILKPGKDNKKVPSTNKATNETITATTQSETTQAISENTTEVTRENDKRPSKPETAQSKTK